MRKQEAAMTALGVLREHPQLNIENPDQQDMLYGELFDAIWPIDEKMVRNDPYLEEMAIEHEVSEPAPGVMVLKLVLKEQRRGNDTTTQMTYRRSGRREEWELVDMGTMQWADHRRGNVRQQGPSASDVRRPRPHHEGNERSPGARHQPEEGRPSGQRPGAGRRQSRDNPRGNAGRVPGDADRGSSRNTGRPSTYYAA